MTDEICCGSSFGTFEEQDKVLVALSGGVDSSVCIQILRDQGFDVQAVVIRFSPAHDAAVRAAQTVARQLGVPLIEEDCTEEFEQQVVEPFCAQYCAGRTPSPCVLCNPRVKFAALARVADRLGIRYIATGHYARVTEENGLYYVRAAVSPERDQSYMLYGLPQNILARLCLPVGEFEKSDIREMAASAQLASAGCARTARRSASFRTATMPPISPHAASFPCRAASSVPTAKTSAPIRACGITP